MSTKLDNSSFRVGVWSVFITVFFSMLLCLDNAGTNHSNMLEPCDDGKCCVGQRIDSATGSCVPCQPGTFIDICNHNCMDCRPCTAPEPSNNEMVLSNCTAVSDTLIGCIHDHYRVKEDALSSSCEPCTKCANGSEVVSRCEGGNNTICSPMTTVASQTNWGAHVQMNRTVLSRADSKLGGQSSNTVTVIVVTVLVTATAIVVIIITIKFKHKIMNTFLNKPPYIPLQERTVSSQETDLKSTTQT